MATITTNPSLPHAMATPTPFIKNIAKPHPILAGMISGQIAGLVMAAALAAIFYLFMGTSPLFPMQVMASTLLGDIAFTGNSIYTGLLGLIVHLLIPSLFWGFIYGICAKAFSITTYRKSLWIGIGIGVLAMLGPYYVIPVYMEFMHGTDIWNREIPMLWNWIGYLVFGITFVIYPKIALGIGRKYNMVAKETKERINLG